MSDASITVTVRVRPFSEKEKFFFSNPVTIPATFGDGNLSSPAPGLVASSSSDGLKPRPVKRIVQVLDERVLIFDPPDHDPLNKLQRQMIGGGGKRQKDVRYAFDRVFAEDASQEAVFENTTKPLLDGILNGFNATVFAYGATGCGKTHTISGAPEDPGIIFLTMSELYAMCDAQAADKTVEISLSYLEIYNETIRDLLVPNTGMADSKIVRGQGGLMLREDADKSIRVAGLSQHHPKAAAEVIDMIMMGNQSRTMSPTEANATSSRSHAVLQINVRQKLRTADVTDCWTSATLSIIDLAGSERASATKNKGARLTEGANINRSLLALGNCINALCDPHRRAHIPYRDSKLTRLLRFSLGGNCKTVMIVCVSPSSSHYDETHNTLKYGNRAKNIKTKVTRNTLNIDRHVTEYVKAIYDLRLEVDELKKKLAQKTGVDNTVVIRERAGLWRTFEEHTIKMRNATDQLSTKFRSAAKLQSCLDELQTKRGVYQCWLRALASHSDMDTSPLHTAISSLDDEIQRTQQRLDMIDLGEGKSTQEAMTESARTALRAKKGESEIISVIDRESATLAASLEAERVKVTLESTRRSNASLASTLETILSAIGEYTSSGDSAESDQRALCDAVSGTLNAYSGQQLVIDYSLPPISPQKPLPSTKSGRPKSRYSLAPQERVCSAPMSIQMTRTLGRNEPGQDSSSVPSRAASTSLGSKARRASLTSFNPTQQSIKSIPNSPAVYRVRSPKKTVSFRRLSTSRPPQPVESIASTITVTTSDPRKKVRWGDECSDGELEQSRTDSDRTYTPSPAKVDTPDRGNTSLTPSPGEDETSPPGSVMRATNSIKRRRSLMNPNFFASTTLNASSKTRLTPSTTINGKFDTASSSRFALGQLDPNSIPRKLSQASGNLKETEQYGDSSAFESPHLQKVEMPPHPASSFPSTGPIRNTRRKSRLSYVPTLASSASHAADGFILDTVDEESPTVVVATGRGLGVARRVSADAALQDREKENKIGGVPEDPKVRNQMNGVGSLGLGLSSSNTMRLLPKSFESAADKLTKQYTGMNSRQGFHRRHSSMNSAVVPLDLASDPMQHDLGIEDDSHTRNATAVASGLPGLPSGMSIKVGKPVWR